MHLLPFTVKNWDRSCYVIGLKKYPDLASTRFQIHSAFKTFHSGERIQKTADSYAVFTEYVWTEAVSGKKKLWIQKYPDTCVDGVSRQLFVADRGGISNRKLMGAAVPDCREKKYIYIFII